MLTNMVVVKVVTSSTCVPSPCFIVAPGKVQTEAAHIWWGFPSKFQQSRRKRRTTDSGFWSASPKCGRRKIWTSSKSMIIRTIDGSTSPVTLTPRSQHLTCRLGQNVEAEKLWQEAQHSRPSARRQRGRQRRSKVLDM